MFQNYENQSTLGLKSDKLCYDVVGFGALVIYESSMYFSQVTREVYEVEHDGKLPEVEINDVWFALHSMLLTFIVIGQMIYYDGWQQLPTRIALTISGFLVLLAVLMLFSLQFLQWLYLLSAIKVIITGLKFYPQVMYNYKRKSTQGWSIHGCIMDLVGSVLSILQLVSCSVH